MYHTFVSLAGVTAVLFAAAPLAMARKAPASPKEEEAKLIAVLTKPDATRKAKADACRELGRVGTRDAVAPLAALLCNEELSHMARYGLEPIPDPAVDAALRDALDKVKGRLEVGIIGSLGVRRDSKAAPALIKRLESSDPEVASAAARALGRIGNPQAVEALEKALAKAPEGGRPAICEGLFRCADVLRTQGQRPAARAIYEHLGNAQVPEYVKAGAKRGEQTLQPRARGR